MPAAITPPPSIKGLAVPKTSMMATQNADTLNTKRKIICFSGMHADLVDPPPTPRRLLFKADFRVFGNGHRRSPALRPNKSHFGWGIGNANDLADFDGTIFMQDTGHILFDAHGCGSQRREILDEQIKTGERSFREVSEEMWGSLNVPFEDGFEVMEKTLEIDPAFQVFHKFCIANKIPFNVISAGLKPILRKVLDTFLGEEESAHIDIVANDAHITEDGSEWKPVWRHDTELGHDKALSIAEAREEAKLQA